MILSLEDVPLAPEELEAILGDGVPNEDGEDFALAGVVADDADRTALEMIISKFSYFSFNFISS